MAGSESILQDSGDMEKGAYLGAIASIATADRQATPEEVEYLSALADAAGLSGEQKEAVIAAANEISDDDVLRCLDILKTSDLRFSLVTDLIAFAKTDNNYSEDEQKSVKKMADYLGLNNEQFSLLDHFTEKAKDIKTADVATASATPNKLTGSATEPEQKDFLSSLGLKEKLQSAGINGSGLLKGLLGIAAPMILAKMVTGGLNRNRGGMFGGGLGSVFSMLNGGGRGYRRSGGLLSRIFRGGF